MRNECYFFVNGYIGRHLELASLCGRVFYGLILTMYSKPLVKAYQGCLVIARTSRVKAGSEACPTNPSSGLNAHMDIFKTDLTRCPGLLSTAFN
jgi:hypothetical protein